MKKILISFALSVLTIIIIYTYKPILIKYLVGNVFIIDKVKSYRIKIDGILHKDILFKDKNKLILFLENQETAYEYSIISIDLINNVVGFNCSSKDCYDTFLGNLFQSDMGKMFVLFSDKYKGPNFDSELKINEESIEFYIPKKGNGKIHVQLILNDPCI